MLNIEVFDAPDVPDERWLEMQALLRAGYASSLAMPTEDKLDSLVGAGDPDRFVASHRNPNSEVGERYSEGQTFYRPKVAIADVDGKIIGFGYAADNTSGETQEERDRKHMLVYGRHFWLRELVVAPEIGGMPGYQQHGHARTIGRHLLAEAHPLQPTSTYIWPGEIPFLESVLERAGYKRTGSQNIDLYGTGSKDVEQARMAARFVMSVNRKLR